MVARPVHAHSTTQLTGWATDTLQRPQNMHYDLSQYTMYTIQLAVSALRCALIFYPRPDQLMSMTDETVSDQRCFSANNCSFVVLWACLVIYQLLLESSDGVTCRFRSL